MGGNQFFLGSGGNQFDPSNIENQLRLLKDYESRLKAIDTETKTPELTIWTSIDSELSSLTEEQKDKLMCNKEYADNYNKLQELVQSEILNLVKPKIERTSEGQELLKKQLELTKKLKTDIVNETNQEMELFKKFKEYSKLNPDVTYEQFLKSKVW